MGLGRSDSGRFMRLHKRFRSRLSLGDAGLSALGSVSVTWETDGLRLMRARTAVTLGKSQPLSGLCSTIWHSGFLPLQGP